MDVHAGFEVLWIPYRGRHHVDRAGRLAVPAISGRSIPRTRFPGLPFTRRCGRDAHSWHCAVGQTAGLGEGRARHRDELRRVRPLCRCPPPCRPIRCRHVLLQLPAVSPGTDRHGHRVIPGIRRHLTNHFVAGRPPRRNSSGSPQSGLVDVSQLWILADHKGPPAGPALRSPAVFLRCAGAAFLALVGRDVPVRGYAVGDLSSSSSRRLERNLNAIPTATMTTREPARTDRPAPGSGTAMIVAAMKRSTTICGQVIMRFFGTAILISSRSIRQVLRDHEVPPDTCGAVAGPSTRTIIH